MVQVHRMYVGMLVPIIQWHMMLRYDMIAPTLKHTPKFMKAVITGCFYVLIQKFVSETPPITPRARRATRGSASAGPTLHGEV